MLSPACRVFFAYNASPTPDAPHCDKLTSREGDPMIDKQAGGTSRREFFRKTGGAAGASALAGIALPPVHAAENNTVQVALVGCGGRGTGAAVNALSVTNGPTKLVAMADVVPKKLNDSYDKLKTQFAG